RRPGMGSGPRPPHLHRRGDHGPPRPVVRARTRPRGDPPQRTPRPRQHGCARRPSARGGAHRRARRPPPAREGPRRVGGQTARPRRPAPPRRRRCRRVGAHRARPPRGARAVKHLLVTNDFPPKVGGIQSYLWELWRRLPPESFAVLTTPYPGAAEWDADQRFRVERTAEKVLLPTRALRDHIDGLAAEVGAELVVLDPALPVGALGPSLATPYDVVLHGAEITVPGRLPGSRQALRRVLVAARQVIAAGGYPLAEAERAAGRSLPAVVVPPGVDVDRFCPLDDSARRAARAVLGLPTDATVVLGLSRLVPRKGFDVLLDAAARLAPQHPSLLVAI